MAFYAARSRGSVSLVVMFRAVWGVPTGPGERSLVDGHPRRGYQGPHAEGSWSAAAKTPRSQWKRCGSPADLGTRALSGSSGCSGRSGCGRALRWHRGHRTRTASSRPPNDPALRERSGCAGGPAFPVSGHPARERRAKSRPPAFEYRSPGSGFPVSGPQSSRNDEGNRGFAVRPRGRGVSPPPRPAGPLGAARERAVHAPARSRQGTGGDRERVGGARLSMGLPRSRLAGVRRPTAPRARVPARESPSRPAARSSRRRSRTRN